jgi:hypothetical protein
MAKGNEGLVRISQFAKKDDVVTPIFNAKDMVGKELAFTSWEFKTSEKGTDFVEIQAIRLDTRMQVSVRSWDKAVIAQLGAVPADAQMPIAARFVKHGEYLGLE